MEAAPQGAINLALGELSYPMPQSLKDKTIEILRDGNPRYTSNAGLIELREIIAHNHGCAAEQVCVCNGAEEAIFIALMSLINPGDSIAIPDPDYPAYPTLGKILESQVQRLHFIDGFSEIDWEQWEATFKTGIKAVLLSSPSNPSGFCFSECDATKFGDLCNQYGIIVIVDEIYANLYYGEAPVSLQGHVQHLIRIGGLSKSHCLSGWRIGWIIAPQEIATAMVKAKQYISTCSNWLSQQLAIFALSKQGMAEAETIRLRLKQSHQYIKRELQAELPALFETLHLPESTPYIMLKTINPDDLEVGTQIANAGLITVPGSAFGDSTKGWIRLNIGVEIPLLEQSIAILKQLNRGQDGLSFY